MKPSEADYDALAARELDRLVAALDALEPEVEAELSSGILTIELAGGRRCVVNSHRAARQIWMAADATAWHFDWDPDSGTWVACRTGEELWSALGSVLGVALRPERPPGHT